MKAFQTTRWWVILCLSGFFTFVALLSDVNSVVQKKQPATGRTPATSQQIIDVEPVPDEQIENRIRSVLLRIDDFKNVRVAVNDGVVRLTGEIARADAKEKLERLVSRFQGVIYVDNKLKITTDVETGVEPVLQKVADYSRSILQQLPLIALALLVAGLFWVVGLAISRIAPQYGWFGINPMIKSLVSRLFTVVFVIAGIVIALDILDVTALVGAVIGTAGIAGLAIGFAFKDIVENYLAGLLLSIRSLFSINDHVVVGNHEGRVVRLTSREIVIMTLEGNHLLIPNSTVFKSVIVNFTRNHLRRFDFEIGVGVSEDLATCKRVGWETLRAMKGVLSDPGPFMRIEELGDFSVKIRFFGWIDQRSTDYFKVRSEAIRLVKEAFDEAGIEMPLPTYVRYARPAIAEEAVTPIEKEPPTEIAEEIDDVSVDRQLDPQIEQDLKTSDEDNYLKEKRS